MDGERTRTGAAQGREKEVRQRRAETSWAEAAAAGWKGRGRWRFERAVLLRKSGFGNE